MDVSKFAGFKGTFWFVEGLIFQGGFGFRRRKSPLLALDNTKSPFSKNSPAPITPFSENNRVNTVK